MPSSSDLPTARGAARRVQRGERGGFTILLVLALISMTLGVSYSLLRTQAASARASNNGQTRIAARQAAWGGLSAGMRRISQTTWGGVGTTITGNLTGSDSYSITFTTGDATLPVTGTAGADYPYRVTLASTGYSVDPSSASATTTYKIEAVLRLTPKALPTSPTAYTTALPYVFYQTATDNISVQLPLKINGPQRWQGGLTTFCSVPTTTSQVNRYLSDLYAMRNTSYGDCRPFTGPITMPTGSTTTTVRSQMTTSLGLTLTNSTAVTTSNFSHPGSVSTYKLYAGGPSYTIPSLAATISATTLQPDARTNPAGLFYRNGDLTLGSGTTVIGTLIVSGNTIFTGTNINISAYSMSALTTTTSLPQLPVIISSDDVRLNAGCSAVVRGVVTTFDVFTSVAGTQNTTFDLQGNLIARTLDIQTRSEWNLGTTWWGLLWTAFNSQGSQPYWPVYASGSSVDYTPRLTIAAGTGTPLRQWFNKDQPIYAVGSGDAGLQWSVLRVTELR